MNGHDAPSAEEQKADDLAIAKASGLWDEAVAALREKLGEQPDALERIRAQAFADPEKWWISHHFAGGMAIRNLLRELGFGEMELGIANLDNVYVELLGEAAEILGPARQVFEVRPAGAEAWCWWYPDGTGLADLYRFLEERGGTYEIRLGESPMTREEYDAMTTGFVDWRDG